MNYQALSTEESNPKSEFLDQMPALEIATLMNTLDATVIKAVRQALPQIAGTAEEAARRIAAGGRLFYVGAGTSGRLGVLDASECPPTFGVSPETVVGIMAGGNAALRNAAEGAEDDAAMGEEDLRSHMLCSRDIVVAISASGSAQYCIGALQYAAAVGAFPVAMCCNSGALLSSYARIAIEMPTGAEVLSGSTRLKAGTATKLALNMVSTAAMVRLGKAYGNLMVDVQPSNAKLRNRAHRIVMKACKITEPEAKALLQAAGGNPKRAIVMKLAGTNAGAAEQALEQAGGFVRTAIKKIKEEDSANG